jgi:hypothetical protein
LYVLYLEWLVEEDLDGELANIPARAYDSARSGVASLLSSIFNVNLAERKWNKLLSKSFHKEHPSKPRHFVVWQITDLLNYLRNFSSDFNEFDDPIAEAFMFLQRKTAALLMTFAFIRPAELAKIRVKEIFSDKEGIFLPLGLKAHAGEITNVFVPKLPELAIDPVIHVDRLISDTLALCLTPIQNLTFLFSSIISGERLPAQGISRIVKRLLKEAELEPNQAYSIKKATTSYLVSKNVPRQTIEDALNYKNRKTVLGKYYAPLESLKRLPLLIAASIGPPPVITPAPKEKEGKELETKQKVKVLQIIVAD